MKKNKQKGKHSEHKTEKKDKQKVKHSEHKPVKQHYQNNHPNKPIEYPLRRNDETDLNTR